MIARPYSLLCLSVALSLTCCAGQSADLGLGDDDDSDSFLSVTPEAPAALGYFEKQQFSVRLRDGTGTPLADRPISARIVGSAHNADLSPLELQTDSEGLGVFVFTAPGKDVDLDIRFSSPSAGEVHIPVEIDPDKLGIGLLIDYDGGRDFDEVTVKLFAGATCDVAIDDEGVPVVASVTGEAIFPREFSFKGLSAAGSYAALVTAMSETGEIRGIACRDGLLAADEAQGMMLEDIPLELEGTFEILLEVSTGSALSPGVEALAAPVEEFAAQAPGRILDVIAASLDSPGSIAQFEEVRASEELDSALAQDLADREVDLPGDMADLWTMVEGRLEVLDIRSRLDLGPAVEGQHEFYHWLGSLAYNGAADTAYQILLSDPGTGLAGISTQNVDLLQVEDHSLGLGLGSVIYSAFSAQLEADHGSPTLSIVLEQLIDCDAVAAFLDEPLSGIVDYSDIRIACVDAALLVHVDLATEAALQDALYSRLSYQDGSCLFVVPEHGDLVRDIEEGSFSIEWCGVDCTEPLYGSFDGTLVVEPT